MDRTYAFSFCCLPRHLAGPANEHNSHRFGEWNSISSVNFQQNVSGIHNFSVDRRLTAAQFSVGSLTCSEIRKFTELYGIHLRRWSPPLRERLRRRWRWDQLRFITEWSCGASRSWLWQISPMASSATWPMGWQGGHSTKSIFPLQGIMKIRTCSLNNSNPILFP